MVKQSNRRRKTSKDSIKVGFIGEGESEYNFLKKLRDKGFFSQYNIVAVSILSGNGREKLIFDVAEKIKICQNKGAEKIIILADVEKFPCFTTAMADFSHKDIDKIILAKKTLESWFLADNEAMAKLLRDKNYYYNTPENTPRLPWNVIKEEFSKRNIHFTENKVVFTNRIFDSGGFSIDRAASHKNCHSARYFLSMIQNLNENLNE